MSDGYPLEVVYCGNCGLPPEFCINGVKFESCKPWLRANVPGMYPQLVVDEPKGGDGSGDGADAAAAGVAAMTVKDRSGSNSDSDSDSDSEDDAPKKKTQRGGQVQRGGPKKKASMAGAVTVTTKDRGRKKYVTTISGLDCYEHLKLKEVASALGKKFGAGASVTKSADGKPEIDVQGDLCYELKELLPTMFGIPEGAIVK